MVAIEFLGGAKKSFPSGRITLECENMTISDMLHMLIRAKPPDTPSLDTKNILVAVNGADSSSLGGLSAILHDNDRVSIIPVIHGGQAVRFEILDTVVSALCVSSVDLDALRQRFPHAHIQAVSSRHVLGLSHLRRILEVSLESRRRGIMIAKSLESDILLRLAGTTQIAQAIRMTGVVPGMPAVVMAIGPESYIVRLAESLADVTEPFPSDNDQFLMGQFNKAALDAGHALEDLLVERASIL